MLTIVPFAATIFTSAGFRIAVLNALCGASEYSAPVSNRHLHLFLHTVISMNACELPSDDSTLLIFAGG
jgi:hypothetical protein